MPRSREGRPDSWKYCSSGLGHGQMLLLSDYPVRKQLMTPMRMRKRAEGGASLARGGIATGATTDA